LTTYLALLRGINVGSTTKVPMKELRSLFEDLGHDNVQTYVRSGNVVFDSAASSQMRLASTLEDGIGGAFGFQVSVILRSQRELQRIAAGNPFLTEDIKPVLLHVIFLADRVSAAAVKKLDPQRSPPDEFRVNGREIFLHFPNGSGRSKLNLGYFEEALGTRGTARNWNTVTKLFELMRAG
jgi:uncharacterized protein (DUF1697 family)